MASSPSSPTWPATDRPWLDRYRGALAAHAVPDAARERRERELLEAVIASGEPAERVLGEARAVAAEVAAELATREEEVVRSEASLRPAVVQLGGTLLGLALVAAATLGVRAGWTFDLALAELLVAAGVAAFLVLWTIGRSLLAGGRPGATTAVVIAGIATAVGGAVLAARVGPGQVLLADAPTLLAALVLALPGVALLVVARRMRAARLREDWSDDAWLRRFRGALRSRLVPRARVEAHVTEAASVVAEAGEGAAHREFGHPLAYARELADADARSRSRRWRLAALAGVGAPLAVAALVLVTPGSDAIEWLELVVLALLALVGAVSAWRSRPGARA
jgi:hypothetical protein